MQRSNDKGMDKDNNTDSFRSRAGGIIRLRNGFTGERSIVLPDMARRICEDDPFISQLYITDIGYYPHAMYHYRERLQGVGQYVLIYCVKGSGWYIVDGHRYEVNANHYFIIPSGSPHVYASLNSDPWTIYWIHFTGKMADVYGAGSREPIAISPGTTSRIAERNSLFEEIFLTLSDGYSSDSLRYASSLLYSYLASFRYLSIYRRSNVRDRHASTIDTVDAAVRYMQENIARPLTLSDLSRYTGYSPSQLSLLFKTRTGHSPLNYFSMLRIHRACQLLETTDLHINQICSVVGIDDSFYFSRLFSKTVGISPKRYRQARRKENEC